MQAKFYMYVNIHIFIFVNNFTSKKMSIFSRVFAFYLNGFKNMTIGKTLWAVILLKLFIMFVILRLFFFPNFLKTNYNTDEERSEHVKKELINLN